MYCVLSKGIWLVEAISARWQPALIGRSRMGRGLGLNLLGPGFGEEGSEWAHWAGEQEEQLPLGVTSFKGSVGLFKNLTIEGIKLKAGKDEEAYLK